MSAVVFRGPNPPVSETELELTDRKRRGFTFKLDEMEPGSLLLDPFTPLLGSETQTMPSV